MHFKRIEIVLPTLEVAVVAICVSVDNPSISVPLICCCPDIFMISDAGGG